MRQYIPLILSLILATSLILMTPVQVFAMTTTLQYQVPNLPIPPYALGNGSLSFLMTDFHYSQKNNYSFMDVNASLASVISFVQFRTEKNYVFIDIEYDLTLNGVSAKWGNEASTGGNFWDLKLSALNLKGQAYINGNSTTITSSASAPLYSIIGAVLKI